MPTWEIDGPQRLDLERVTRLRVRIVGGRVSVVGSDDPPRLEVAEVRDRPLRVRLDDDGALEVGYDDRSRPGPLSWLDGLRTRRRYAEVSLAVPRDCPVDLGAVSATLLVSGLRGRVDAKVVSGDVTLAGLAGPVNAGTVSGSVEAHAVRGSLRMRTVSGDVTLAEGLAGPVDAATVSGSVTCDLSGAPVGAIELRTVSGDVLVRVPDASDLDVRLQSTSGDVSSAFDGLERDTAPGRKRVSGRLGAGTGRLQVTATSGDVALLRGGAADAEPA